MFHLNALEILNVERAILQQHFVQSEDMQSVETHAVKLPGGEGASKAPIPIAERVNLNESKMKNRGREYCGQLGGRSVEPCEQIPGQLRRLTPRPTDMQARAHIRLSIGADRSRIYSIPADDAVQMENVFLENGGRLGPFLNPSQG